MFDQTSREDDTASQRLLTVQDFARRWRVSESRIRNTSKELLPPRVVLPGSRLVRYRSVDVIEWEAKHVR